MRLSAEREIEIEYISEISLTTDPAVPDAKFIVIKSEMGTEDIESEILEEMEVQKSMDIEKLLKSIVRKLKNIKKSASLEKAQEKIDKLIKEINKILEEGGEYGYPAPEEVAKSIDAIEILADEDDEISPASAKQSELSQTIARLEGEVNSIKEILELQSEILSKLVERGG